MMQAVRALWGAVQIVEATNGGLIDLASVAEIRSGSGSHYSNRLQFKVNSGGNIDLSNLQSIESNGSLGVTQFLIDVPVYELPTLSRQIDPISL